MPAQLVAVGYADLLRSRFGAAFELRTLFGDHKAAAKQVGA